MYASRAARRRESTEDLRPAQLGIVLRGRVILGHVTATLVDLAQRGFLGLDEVQGNTGPDWLLADLRDHAAHGSRLLRFEVTLLDGLFARQSAVRLSELGQTRRELRALAVSGNSEALAGLVSYAMIFGFGAPSTVNVNDSHDLGTDRQGGKVPWSQSDRFATSWLAACAQALNQHGHRHQSGADQHGDLVREWSAPHDHTGGGRGHGLGHGGYGGYRNRAEASTTEATAVTRHGRSMGCDSLPHGTVQADRSERSSDRIDGRDPRHRRATQIGRKSRTLTVVALGHDKACRAGQWPPRDHRPAGDGQQVAYLILAVDVPFAAAHEPFPGHQGSEDRLGVGGISPEVH